MENTLPTFLRSLADRIDNKELDNSTLKQLSEIYIEHLYKQKPNPNKRRCCSSPKYSQQDFRKFLFLGWYIYNTQELNNANN